MKKFFIATQSALTIISAFIGAGFASGAEIARFFINFNIFSVHFAFFVGILFGIFIYVNTNSETDYTPGLALNIAETIIFFILTSTMISGINIISKIILPKFPIVTIICVITAYILLQFDFNKWTKISAIICITILLTIILNFFLNIPYRISTNNYSLNVSTFCLPIIYLCMNCFSIYPLVQSLGQFITSKKDRIITAMLSGSILITLIVIILLTISNHPNGTMPLLDSARDISSAFYNVYIVILLLSIFTTLLSSFYTLSKHTIRFVKNPKINFLVCFISATMFSFIGFQNIVTIFYPVLGIIGLVFIIRQIILNHKFKQLHPTKS